MLMHTPKDLNNIPGMYRPKDSNNIPWMYRPLWTLFYLSLAFDAFFLRSLEISFPYRSICKDTNRECNKYLLTLPPQINQLLKYRIRPNYRTYPYMPTVKQFRSLQITAIALICLLLYKGICCQDDLNCIDLSMHLKWVLTIYAFIKKIRKRNTQTLHKHHLISPSLIFFFKVYP